jgi:hypothetical protein
MLVGMKCLACIEDLIASMGDMIEAGQARSDGAIPCGCGGGFPLEAVRPGISQLAFNTWNRARLRSHERALMGHLRKQTLQQADVQRQARDPLSVEAQQHAQHIRNEILTDCCPRCRMPFIFVGGTLALMCISCRCGFCSFCFEDCGNDAHLHTYRCMCCFCYCCCSVHHRTLLCIQSLFIPAGEQTLSCTHPGVSSTRYIPSLFPAASLAMERARQRASPTYSGRARRAFSRRVL